jgi:hypothetical protein
MNLANPANLADGSTLTNAAVGIFVVLGRTPSRPELADAPHYKLVIELHFPNLAPMDARTVQPVPLTQVPNLAIGLELPCAVDPANPQACVVDWDAIPG